MQFMHSMSHFIWVNQNRRDTIVVTGIEEKILYVCDTVLLQYLAAQNVSIQNVKVSKRERHLQRQKTYSVTKC
jgi:hypothetical protein